MKITKELCISEIKRIYNDHGKITVELIKEHACVSYDSIRRRFGSLSNAYKEAGISVV